MASVQPIRHSVKSATVSVEKPVSWFPLLLKLILLLALIAFTNTSFVQRVSLLLNAGRLQTLLPFIAIWGVAVAALIIAALQPNLWVRGFWALVTAISAAASWGYASASNSQLNVFEILSLWNARHEADRAANFYVHHVMLALAVLAAGFIVMMLPGTLRGKAAKWLTRLAWVPVVPIAMIAGIVLMKSGGGSQGMPSQFSTIALGSLAGEKIATQGSVSRGEVTWQPSAMAHRTNIVMLIDESVGADFIDLTPGNPHTPNFAKHAAQFVNYGRAASGGNCSNYSNSILRMAASRSNLVDSINASPTLWQFAKKAGYRTVFIDAQAGNISDPGLMQNFMTMKERESIDVFHAIRGVESYKADGMLADLIAKELQSNQPTFIYANKNGAHFPYDDSYPASETHYHPSTAEAGADTDESRMASYRNAVAWSVDLFMDKLLTTTNFSNTTLLYTSDHAQTFNRNTLTHCIVDNPDPFMGVVPLMVMTPDAADRAALEKGAALLKGRASHFQIAPTVLSWMGYAPADIATRYDENLYSATTHEPAFTSGDVFGLFSKTIFVWPLDLTKDLGPPTLKTVLPKTQLDGVAG
jgi:glucan phosphoethanolaminetransferase (alkaline phosphatase superfamily)